jgi:hypothetical protein
MVLESLLDCETGMQVTEFLPSALRCSSVALEDWQGG